jgi:hypothetical protein
VALRDEIVDGARGQPSLADLERGVREATEVKNEKTKERLQTKLSAAQARIRYAHREYINLPTANLPVLCCVKRNDDCSSDDRQNTVAYRSFCGCLMFADLRGG